MPFSFAILRASGDAFTRLSSAVDGPSVSASVVAAASAAAGAPSSADLPAGASSSCNNGVISVPSLPTMAIMPCTGAASPSLGPIYNKVPSSYPTTSMVALSVSTSASESSDFTLSPTLKFHLLITPSVMVSLRAGIRITTAGMLLLSIFGFASTGAEGFFSSTAAGVAASAAGAGLLSAAGAADAVSPASKAL